VRPTQDTLHLTYRGRSIGVERALVDFGAEESYARASTRFTEHYGYDIGRTTVQRVVKSHAMAAETFVAQTLAAQATAYDESVATRPGVDAMLVEMDGCEIRTGMLEKRRGRRKTAVRRLPVRQRPSAWRAVRLAFARELSSVTKTYVGGLRSFEAVGSDLFAAAVSRGLSSRTNVVGVADGGNGVYELLDSTFTPFQFILDNDALGLRNMHREQWVYKMVTFCEQGNVQRALAVLRRHKGRGKTRCNRLHGYLTRFSKAVHYDAFRKKGYPIGSGEIESGHRVIPQKRLKIPGACWRPDSINPMMSLRILRENGWWHDFWRNPNHGL
jgi:hypothetical protein